MNATLKSTGRIKGAKLLPPLPSGGKPMGADELKAIEAFIRSQGGKPMTKATKKRLAKAGCLGWPDE